MNGPYAILFKAQLVLLPITIGGAVAWATWATKELWTLRTEFVSFVSAGGRFSSEDGVRLEFRLSKEDERIKESVGALEKEFSEKYMRWTEHDLYHERDE